jgi:hypothetical protein
MKPSDIDLKRKFSEAYVNNDVDAAIEYLERIVDETNNLFESWKKTRKNLSDKDKEYVLHSLAISFMVLAELYLRKEDNEQAIFYAIKTCTFPDANLEEMDIQSTHYMANLMLDHLIPKELVTQIKLIKFKQDLKDNSTVRKQPLLGKIDWSGLDPVKVVDLYRQYLEPDSGGDLDARESVKMKPKKKDRPVEVSQDVLATKWVKDEDTDAYVEIKQETKEQVGPTRVVVRRKAKRSSKKAKPDQDDWQSLNDHPKVVIPSIPKPVVSKKRKGKRADARPTH